MYYHNLDIDNITE